MFIFKKRFWLTALKIFALLFVGGMILVQVPELCYDLGPKNPTIILRPDDLNKNRFPSATFVSLKGTPDFSNAFVYRRYSLAYTYFNIQPYGTVLVVRTYDNVDEEWKALNRFIGKLRPFERQPFSYRIRQIYLDKFQIHVPKEAFFLALDDVPRLSGWQIGAVAFAGVLWLVMFYMFFFFGRKATSE